MAENFSVNPYQADPGICMPYDGDEPADASAVVPNSGSASANFDAEAGGQVALDAAPSNTLAELAATEPAGPQISKMGFFDDIKSIVSGIGASTKATPEEKEKADALGDYLGAEVESVGEHRAPTPAGMEKANELIGLGKKVLGNERAARPEGAEPIGGKVSETGLLETALLGALGAAYYLITRQPPGLTPASMVPLGAAPTDTRPGA